MTQKSYCNFLESMIMIAIRFMTSGNDHLCIKAFILTGIDILSHIKSKGFRVRGIFAALRFVIISFDWWVTRLTFTKKLQLLWFGYCTWPCCNIRPKHKLFPHGMCARMHTHICIQIIQIYKIGLIHIHITDAPKLCQLSWEELDRLPVSSVSGWSAQQQNISHAAVCAL